MEQIDHLLYHLEAVTEDLDPEDLIDFVIGFIQFGLTESDTAYIINHLMGECEVEWFISDLDGVEIIDEESPFDPSPFVLCLKYIRSRQNAAA